MTDACPARVARPVLVALLLGAGPLLAPAVARADDLDREPIRYATAPADNAVSRLQKRIDAGETLLAHEDHFGYLRPLLRELNVPVSSQALVFSKTSFQRDRIAPRSPRAVYFGDDAYVGFCQGGEVLEVSAVDPRLGAVFYTLDQRGAGRPRFVRQTDNCVICHASSLNQGLPGHVVRSLYVDEGGLPLLSLGGYRTDHTSPLAQRWGGWYVTGTVGGQGHLGNLVLTEDNPRLPVDNAAGRNVTDLRGRFRTAGYLSPHSDIVALMVLEHQTEMHNRIARATLQTRLALYEEADINRALGRPADYRSESTARRIAAAGDSLVQYLLFSGEAALAGPVAGTSHFAREFAARGPRDRRGRSLRDFDLQTRLFRHPCSYLVYSPAFDAMPRPVKDHVLRRTWEVLTGKDAGAEYAHLSAADRRAVLEILLDTKPGLPPYWRRPADSGPP
jgi:hypothetical protein